MSAVATPGSRVGKKKTPDPTPDPAFGRIELQAPPDWIAELDALARRVGLSRSAYIRLACNNQMDKDRERPERKEGE